MSQNQIQDSAEPSSRSTRTPNANGSNDANPRPFGSKESIHVYKVFLFHRVKQKPEDYRVELEKEAYEKLEAYRLELKNSESGETWRRFEEEENANVDEDMSGDQPSVVVERNRKEKQREVEVVVDVEPRREERLRENENKAGHEDVTAIERTCKFEEAQCVQDFYRQYPQRLEELKNHVGKDGTFDRIYSNEDPFDVAIDLQLAVGRYFKETLGRLNELAEAAQDRILERVQKDTARGISEFKDRVSSMDYVRMYYEPAYPEGVVRLMQEAKIALLNKLEREGLAEMQERSARSSATRKETGRKGAEITSADLRAPGNSQSTKNFTFPSDKLRDSTFRPIR